MILISMATVLLGIVFLEGRLIGIYYCFICRINSFIVFHSLDFCVIFIFQ